MARQTKRTILIKHSLSEQTMTSLRKCGGQGIGRILETAVFSHGRVATEVWFLCVAELRSMVIGVRLLLIGPSSLKPLLGFRSVVTDILVSDLSV